MGHTARVPLRGPSIRRTKALSPSQDSIITFWPFGKRASAFFGSLLLFIERSYQCDQVTILIKRRGSPYCSKFFQFASLPAVHVLRLGQYSKPKTGWISQLLCLVRGAWREWTESNICKPVTRTKSAWCGAAVISAFSRAPASFGWSSRTRGVNSAVWESGSSASDGLVEVGSTSTIWLSVSACALRPQLQDSLLPLLASSA